jgi:hypothetical protein
MKRILSGGLVFLCFLWCVDLVFGSAINSMTIGKRQAISSPANVVYRGTLTGLRISSVDGTAFIDNAGATVPTYADGNHQISIFDSSGRELRGVLKAAGESEGLGDELITNGTFASDVSGWTNHATYSFDTVQLSSGAMNVISDGSGTTWCSVYQTASISVTAGQMYKFILDRTVNSGGTPITAFENNPIGTSLVGSLLGTGTSYRTITATDSAAYYNHYIAGATATNFTVDNISLKIVTAPSSSGATIVSAREGTTYNFTHKNSSFTYNAASYYVIVRKIGTPTPSPPEEETDGFELEDESGDLMLESGDKLLKE